MGCCHFYSNLHLAIKVGWCEIYMKDVIIGTEIDGGTDRATLNSLLQGEKYNLCTTVLVMRLSAGFAVN